MQVDDNLTMDESAERNFTVTEPSLVSFCMHTGIEMWCFIVTPLKFDNCGT